MSLSPRRKLWISAILTVLAAVVVVACATVPYTGRSQIMLMSPLEEVKLGA